MEERQEIHCHNCNRYVQFTIDLALNGNHTLDCPNCGHQHFRYVENGIITDVRWRSSAQSYRLTSVTVSATSTGTYYAGTGSYNLFSSWLSTTTTSTNY